MYGARWLPVEAVRRPLAIIDVLARHRYFIDAFYVALYRGVMLGFARIVGWIDRYFVDGILNVLSAWTLRAGDALRVIQTGKPQDYVYGVAFGVLLLFVGVQLVTFGLLAELLARTYYESQNKPTYAIREIRQTPEATHVES